VRENVIENRIDHEEGKPRERQGGLYRECIRGKHGNARDDCNKRTTDRVGRKRETEREGEREREYRKANSREKRTSPNLARRSYRTRNEYSTARMSPLTKIEGNFSFCLRKSA